VRPLAACEAKSILRVHLLLVFQWANANPEETVVSPKVRKALLEMLARMFELVEELPVGKPKTN
jgi:hypothetical protein